VSLEEGNGDQHYFFIMSHDIIFYMTRKFDMNLTKN
jgi:hypothetical protein